MLFMINSMGDKALQSSEEWLSSSHEHSSRSTLLKKLQLFSPYKPEERCDCFKGSIGNLKVAAFFFGGGGIAKLEA